MVITGCITGAAIAGGSSMVMYGTIPGSTPTFTTIILVGIMVITTGLTMVLIMAIILDLASQVGVVRRHSRITAQLWVPLLVVAHSPTIRPHAAR